MPTIVRFHQLGGPENLKIEEAPLAAARKRRGAAAGAGGGAEPRRGSLSIEANTSRKPKLPSRIGYEVAGVVEALGEGVDPSWIGKSVATIPAYGMNQYGTLGEQAVVPASALTEYPANLTPEQAAAAWMQYLTAYGALVSYGKVAAGDFVSIPAASSSVGLAAIDIVRDAGATAIAVTRTAAKKDELIALGAHYVIVSGEEDYAARIQEITGGKGTRVIFDPVAGPYVETLAAGSAREGMLFIYGGLSMQPTPFPLMQSFRTGLSMRAYSVREITTKPERLAMARKYVYDRLGDGRFVPKIAKTFAYKDTVEAYRYLESNQQVGKVVIRVK